jgi:hypothetical protein
MNTSSLLHVALLFAAFWTAVLLYRGERPLCFVAALAVGAIVSHLGWAGLHWQAVAEHPQALFDPGLGYCVLFFPLGPLLLAPEATTWRALPLALAVARAGCLAGGCCGGEPGRFGAHPTPLYEMALLAGLHFAVRAAPKRAAAAVFLAGFGALRLAVEPLRAAPPLGEPAAPVAALSALWLGAGLLVLPARARAALPLLPLLLANGCGVRRVAEPDERPDYLRYVAFDLGRRQFMLLHWEDHEMPLRVHLPAPPSGLLPDPAAIQESARQGILAWTDVASPGIPAFAFVDAAGDAQLPVVWAEEAIGRPIAQCAYSPTTFSGRLRIDQILVTGRRRDGSLATPEEVRLTVMHETGHALGLSGHSPNPDDIMYPFAGVAGENPPSATQPDAAAASTPQPPHRSTAQGLSARDRATLQKLYAKPNRTRVPNPKSVY